MAINAQAQALNDSITNANPHVYNMLSERGKNIYFPKLGILSQSAEAAGKTINATIGTALEDDGSSMCLSGLARRITLDKNAAFAYAPSPGRPEIRKIWREMLVKKNPSLASADYSLPVVTSALTHGLSMAAYLFVNEGDRLIMPDLYWENYDILFGLAFGGQIATFPTFVNNTGFNVDGLRSLLANGPVGKKIVLINFPNNPTGYTATQAEVLAIRDVLVQSAQAGNDLVALIDDAYFGLVFDEGIATESIFTLLCNAHERLLAVKLDGPTKEDYVWGFRVGFVTFGIGGKGSAAVYSALEAKLAGAIRGNISNCSNVSQSLLLAAYTDPLYESEKQIKFDILKNRYATIKEILKKHPEYACAFVALPFNSGYFMCIKLTRAGGEAVRQRLLSNYSTGVIAFGQVIRVAFSATPVSILETLFKNIFAACNDVAQ